MNRALILIALFIAWSIGCVAVGYQWSDGKADTAAAQAATVQQSARADHAEGARATDHANAAASGAVQQQRAEAHATSATEFTTIEKRAAEYVQANPDPAVCDLDADGLRAWHEANAGAILASPERGHPGGPAGP